MFRVNSSCKLDLCLLKNSERDFDWSKAHKLPNVCPQKYSKVHKVKKQPAPRLLIASWFWTNILVHYVITPHAACKISLISFPIQKSNFLFVFFQRVSAQLRLFITKVYFLAFIREPAQMMPPTCLFSFKFLFGFYHPFPKDIRFLITFLFILFIKISSAALRWPLNVRTSATSLFCVYLFYA